MLLLTRCFREWRFGQCLLVGRKPLESYGSGDSRDDPDRCRNCYPHGVMVVPHR